MKKLIILMLFLILVVPIVMSADIQEPITITNISKCYGEADIKIRGDNMTADDFTFVNCSTNKTLSDWKCVCKVGTPISIILKPLSSKQIIYDIVVEYDLEYSDDTIKDPQVNKRTHTFTNVNVNIIKEPEVVKEPFKWPEAKSIGNVIGIIIGVIILIIMVIIYIFKKLFSGNDIDKEEEKIYNDVNKYLEE